MTAPACEEESDDVRVAMARRTASSRWLKEPWLRNFDASRESTCNTWPPKKTSLTHATSSPNFACSASMFSRVTPCPESPMGRWARRVSFRDRAVCGVVHDRVQELRVGQLAKRQGAIDPPVASGPSLVDVDAAHCLQEAPRRSCHAASRSGARRRSSLPSRASRNFSLPRMRGFRRPPRGGAGKKVRERCRRTCAA